MQYSYVDGQKLSPFPKAKGVCDICGSDTIAKCGEKVMWHWAHKSNRECDPWWENETEWHRNWKAEFPEEFREVAHQCEVTGEKHRADIKADNGIILEIQNSPISLEELRSREDFYKNLVWIVNGEKFKSRFRIFNTYLPNPECVEFDDIVFMPTNNENSCKMFWRKSENSEAVKEPGRSMVLIHPSREIQQEIEESYIGHHPFDWKRPHIVWLKAKCPVFIDFGTDILWRLEEYRNRFLCVCAIAREKIILDIKNKPHVSDIACMEQSSTRKVGIV